MATNRADTLDPALLRPGRLDRKIEFPLPDRRQKRLIFSTITAKMNLSEEVDLEDCIFLPVLLGCLAGLYNCFVLSFYYLYTLLHSMVLGVCVRGCGVVSHYHSPPPQGLSPDTCIRGRIDTQCERVGNATIIASLGLPAILVSYQVLAYHPSACMCS